MTLTLTGQLPSGKNAMKTTRTGHHYASTRFKTWRAEACTQLHDQTLPSKPWQTPVALSCTYWSGDLKTRDVSGMLDAVFHLLVYAGILLDDGLIWNVTWKYRGLNREFPKVIMELEPWT